MTMQEKINITYKYGMRLRGFSIGCQPMNGFIKRYDDTTNKYHDILEYNRELTEEEMRIYALDKIASCKTISIGWGISGVGKSMLIPKESER